MKIDIRKAYPDRDQLVIHFDAADQEEMRQLKELYNFSTMGRHRDLMPMAQIDIANRWLEISIKRDEGTRWIISGVWRNEDASEYWSGYCTLVSDHTEMGCHQ